MRLLIANWYFAPAWGYGGPSRVLYDLAKHLIAMEHEVYVLTSTSSDTPKCYPAGHDVVDGIAVYRVPVFSQWLAFRQKKFYSSSFTAVLRDLAQQFEIVHLCGARDYFVLAGARTLREIGIPYVLSAFGALQPNVSGWKCLGTPVVDALFTRPLVLGAARCLAQTQHELSLYRSYGSVEAREQIVPLAADGRRFGNVQCDGSFRRALNIGDGDRLFLSVARLHRNKGLDTLIVAFAQVVREIPNARLAIVGRDDGYEASLRLLVRNLRLEGNVTFAGGLFGEQLVQAYSESDVFVLTPNAYEETTLAGVEACFCGTQVVVSEQAEIPFLQEAGAGDVVPNEVSRIASALLNAVADDRTITQRGLAARDLAFSRFDWSKVAAEYLSAYQHAITV